MATQLKHTDIRPIPVSASEAFRGLAPTPNVRVAFLAGEATTAVHGAMAKLPREVRDATLDDLVGSGGVSLALKTLLDVADRTKADHAAHYRETMNPAETRFYALSRRTDEESATARIASGLDVAEARSNELLNLDTVAQNAVATYPAATPGDLAAKLAFMVDRDMLMTQQWGPELRADAIRVGQTPAASPSAAIGAVTPAYAKLIADAQAKEAAYLANERQTVRPVNARLAAAAGTAGEGAARTEYEAAHAHNDVLVTACCDAQYAVCNYAVETAEDLRAKLAFMKQHLMGDGMDWTETLLADATRVAGGVRSSTLRALLSQRNAIWEAMDDTELTDEQGAARCREIDSLEQRVLCAPAATSDDALVKMVAALQVVAAGHELEDVEAARVLFDARRHFGIGQVLSHLLVDVPANLSRPDPDTAVLKAFAERRREFVAMEGRDTAQAEEDAYWARVEPLENVIMQTPAKTIAGVLAKLRLAFMHQVGERWSDHAIVDPASRLFAEGINDAGQFTRLAWAAIEDLARIAGVNLSEQGA